MALKPCPTCGHRISENAPVCPQCGEEFRGGRTSESARVFCIMWAVLFTIPAVLVLLLQVFFGGPSASDVNDRPFVVGMCLAGLLVGWLPFLSWRSRQRK